MKVSATNLADVLLIEPPVYRDERGFFCENFSQQRWLETTGLAVEFVQDNHSHSKRGVLRGLHYQLAPHAQGKLVRIVQGSVFTVAVDLRRSSPQLGKHLGIVLRDQQQLWIPAGFAHGFLVLSDTADCLYKTTEYYAPKAERSIHWNDADLGIDWPSVNMPQLSERDQNAQAFRTADLFD